MLLAYSEWRSRLLTAKDTEALRLGQNPASSLWNKTEKIHHKQLKRTTAIISKSCQRTALLKIRRAVIVIKNSTLIEKLNFSYTLSGTYNRIIASKHKKEVSACHKQWQQPCGREKSSGICGRQSIT